MVHGAEGEAVGPAAAEVGDIDILHGGKRQKRSTTQIVTLNTAVDNGISNTHAAVKLNIC